MDRTTDEHEKAAACANCGKEENVDTKLKACAACMLVKYCGRKCQIDHRPGHKKACKKRADELHEEALFNQPPRGEDCPICFLLLPEALFSTGGQAYWSCCGKIICSGCAFADIQNDRQICPFCRAPAPDNIEVQLQQLDKRLEVNDPSAFHNIGCIYHHGDGVVQDKSKAFEYFLRGAQLGSAKALYCVADAYNSGGGVEKDEKKAWHCYELAAMKGDNPSRCNLGVRETRTHKYDRALKHWLISCGRGHYDSLKSIKILFQHGYATKEDYEKALRSYQQYIDEIKSEQRDAAAAFTDEFKYLPLQES